MRSSTLIVVGLLALALTLSVAAELSERQGRIAEVQRIDISGLDGDSLLIMTLKDGGGFLIPDQQNLAAGAGVKVAVEYLPGEDEGDLPLACRVQVLAVPVSVDGEEVLQPAARPFDVYRNPDSRCRVDKVAPDA